MAVAHDAVTQSHSGGGSSSNQASFSWTHAPSGTPKGVLVFTYVHDSSTEMATAVTWGGVSLTGVSGGTAADTAGEPGRCTAWFLGNATSIAGRSGNSVVVTRTNNANLMTAVAITVTAGADTDVHTAGIILLQNDGTLAEQSVTDGSPGTNSVRYAAGFSGLGTAPAVGANTTSLASDGPIFNNTTWVAARETTAGQGSRSVGFSSGTSDDRAFVHLAVKEAATIHERVVAVDASVAIATVGLIVHERTVGIDASIQIAVAGGRPTLVPRLIVELETGGVTQGAQLQ